MHRRLDALDQRLRAERLSKNSTAPARNASTAIVTSRSR
jgi:hypothetical protein